MKAALDFGPVAISADADNQYFRDYEGGLIREPNGCSTRAGHAMLAVGWGHDDTYGDFLIIKNTWGESWGEMGFLRISLT